MLKQETIIRANEETKKKGYAVPEGFTGKIGYFFTQEELKKLLEDAYFEGECFGIGADACINKQDYINKTIK